MAAATVACLCTTVSAQRDFRLAETRNVMLTSHNAASLTTFADSAITNAEIAYGYKWGDARSIAQPFLNDMSFARQQNTINADVRSYYRLNDWLVAYGNVAFCLQHGKGMNGSMFFTSPTFSQDLEVRPFDITDDSLSNAGSKEYKLFHAVGALGWQTTGSLSVGAMADFTAGSYDKFKDLRHSNTLMNLNTNVGLTYSFSSNTGNVSQLTDKGHEAASLIGASFLYRRNTETVNYEMHGTTDRRYSPLIDYAWGIGQTETYGGNGFIDKSNEQPLYNEYCGVAVTGNANTTKGVFYGEFAYLHRNGFYGKESQYTVSHEEHSGNILDWKLRYTLPRQLTGAALHWLELHLNDEQLTTNRNNYRETTTTETGSEVKHYDYFTPTKMSDKILRQGEVTYTAYLSPANSENSRSQNTIEGRTQLFLWRISGGLSWIYANQTPYIPLSTESYGTSSVTCYMPHIEVARSFLFHNSNLLKAELGFKGIGGSLAKATVTHIGCSYEFPIRQYPTIRPDISLAYDWAHRNDNTNRHSVLASIGVTF